MSRLLASPRRRRRILRLGTALAVAGAIGLAVVFVRNTAPPTAKPTAGTPRIELPAKQIPVTRSKLRSALSTAASFLIAGVERKDPVLAYKMSGPQIREGESLAQWEHDWNDPNTGVPITPYHFTQARWRRDYSYANTIGLQVALFPAKTEHQRPTVFMIELTRKLARGHARWLVDSFVPAPTSTSSTGPNTSVFAPAPPDEKSPLGAVWLLAPLSLLSLIVLIPLGLGIRGWYRGRRAMRRYDTSPLRPLR